MKAIWTLSLLGLVAWVHSELATANEAALSPFFENAALAAPGAAAPQPAVGGAGGAGGAGGTFSLETTTLQAAGAGGGGAGGGGAGGGGAGGGGAGGFVTR